MDVALPLLGQLVIQLPMYAVWVVGIFLAVTRRHEHPTGYPLVVVALGLLIAISVIGTFITMGAPTLMLRNGMNMSVLGIILGGFAAFHTLVSTASWVLILMALFRRRTPTTPSAPPASNVSTF